MARNARRWTMSSFTPGLDNLAKGLQRMRSAMKQEVFLNGRQAYEPGRS